MCLQNRLKRLSVRPALSEEDRLDQVREVLEDDDCGVGEGRLTHQREREVTHGLTHG